MRTAVILTLLAASCSRTAPAGAPAPPQAPPPPPAASPRVPLPAVLSDEDALSRLTEQDDKSRLRLWAWAIAFGSGLTREQRDRASRRWIRYLHQHASGLTANTRVKILDERGHVGDLEGITVGFQKWIKKRGMFDQMRLSLADNDVGSEVGFAVANFDDGNFTKVLADLTAGTLRNDLTTAPPASLRGDSVASWVNTSSPESVSNYLAWSSVVAKGLTPTQAARVTSVLVNAFLEKAWVVYLNDRKVQMFDSHGHFRDLAELTFYWQKIARRYGKHAREVMMEPQNFGPEAGAALTNFDDAEYRRQIAQK